MTLGVLATHPIQYQAPLYRALARELDLHVYFAHRQTAEGQADAGFGVAFEWDVPLTDGYDHTFLTNRSRRPGTATFNGCDTPEITDVVRAGRFDAFLVTGWNKKSYWQAMTACWRTGTPLLVRGDSHLGTPRSAVKRVVKEVAYRAFIPRFGGYLIVGERAREYFRHYGADPGRMHFVPHFVDADFFRSRAEAADRPALRERYGLAPDARVVLFAGKFTDVKRPVDFVEAVGALARREGGVEGLMVGDGPLRAELEAAVARTDAPVRLVGFLNQSEMPGAYAVADALALPSVSETWGLVVNEAMACGLPVAVSDTVGCAPDLVDEGRTGTVYPTAGGVVGLAGALERLLPLLGDPATRRALAEKTETYSLAQAVRGTVEAVRAATPVFTDPVR